LSSSQIIGAQLTLHGMALIPSPLLRTLWQVLYFHELHGLSIGFLMTYLDLRAKACGDELHLIQSHFLYPKFRGCNSSFGGITSCCGSSFLFRTVFAVDGGNQGWGKLHAIPHE
jgi:hypothetical protein